MPNGDCSANQRVTAGIYDSDDVLKEVRNVHVCPCGSTAMPSAELITPIGVQR